MKTTSLPLLLVLLTLANPLHAAGPADGDAVDALMRYESGANVQPLRLFEERVRRAVAEPATRPAVEADLIHIAGGKSTFEAKRFACQQLAVIGSEACVPTLAALLTRDDTAGIACAALAQNPSPKASTALRQALASTQGRIRAQVALALGVREDTRAVGALATLTADSDPAVAEAAVIALGKIGNGAARKELARLRTQPVPALDRAVAEASLLAADRLVADGNRKAATAVYTHYLASNQPADLRRAAFTNLLRLDRDGGEKRALAALEGTDAALKPVAIAAVPGLGSAGASKVFAAVLPALEPADQLLLVQALAARGDADARAAVVGQLTAPYELVRHGALSALGSMGDASVVPVLARAVVTARDPGELKAIETALARLQGGEAVDQALAAEVRNRMAGPKWPFLGALVRRASADPALVPLFLAEARSADATMARLAFQGLSRVARTADVEAVLKALQELRANDILDDAQAAVGQFVRRTGTQAPAASVVRSLLEASPDPATQARLLPVLAFCPSAEGLALVTAAANNTQPATRSLGLRTLADWPDPAAYGPLGARWVAGTTDAERVVALRGLVRLLGEQNANPTPELIARYRELFAAAATDTDRKLILGALSGCHHPHALDLAVEQLAQPGIRPEATLAVKQIAEALKTQHPEAAAAALKKLQ